MTRILKANSPALFRQKQEDEDGPAGNRDVLVKASHGELEIKAEGEPGRIKGYGSVFNKVDSYGETVMPGAFTKSLKRWKSAKRPIPMLWQHRSDLPIGVWDEFEEDSKGLLLGGQVNMKTQRGQEAFSDMEMKAVTGLSIGYFEEKADPWDYGSTEPRKLFQLDLRETSPVTFPALKEAQIDAVKMRLAMGQKLTTREFEGMLRERFRFSRSDAEAITRIGYTAWLQRDVAQPDESAELREAMKAISERAPLSLPTF